MPPLTQHHLHTLPTLAETPEMQVCCFNTHLPHWLFQACSIPHLLAQLLHLTSLLTQRYQDQISSLPHYPAKHPQGTLPAGETLSESCQEQRKAKPRPQDSLPHHQVMVTDMSCGATHRVLKLTNQIGSCIFADVRKSSGLHCFRQLLCDNSHALMSGDCSNILYEMPSM